MKRIPWRLGTALALLLSMLGIASPIPVSAQEGTASLTIHSRFCPPGYDMSDVYNDCHDTVGDRGVQYSLWGPGALGEVALGDIPGEDGNLTFRDLPAGGYSFSSTFPSETHQAYVYCSSQYETGRRIELSGSDNGTYLAYFFLVDDENVICDGYTSPNGDFDSLRASVTIHNRWCPVGFSNFGDEWKECFAEDVGLYVNFWISDPVPRYGFALGGNVTFSWLIPADYIITTDLNLPAGIYCSTFDSIGMPFLEKRINPGDSLTLSLDAGDDVICDWYVYPDFDYRKG